MNTIIKAALWITTAATALPLAAVAHADYTSYTFLSPSGNIGCEMEDDSGGTIFAVCKTRNAAWAASPSQNCPQRRSARSYRRTGFRLATEPG